jgi:hypothetical protein
MKHAIICFGLALCSGLASGSAAGEAASENVLLIGDGTSSCGAWTENRSDPARHGFQLAWVLGFISGNNYENPQSQASFRDKDAVAAYIDNYCSLNPLHIIANAAAAIVQDGGGTKAAHTWKR